MDSELFIKKAKQIVADYTNERLDVTDNVSIGEDDVYVVWNAKVLQNNKAMLSTTFLDGMYYEVTHNGDKEEIYFDAYKKEKNIKFDL